MTWNLRILSSEIEISLFRPLESSKFDDQLDLVNLVKKKSVSINTKSNLVQFDRVLVYFFKQPEQSDYMGFAVTEKFRAVELVHEIVILDRKAQLNLPALRMQLYEYICEKQDIPLLEIYDFTHTHQASGPLPPWRRI